MKTIELQWQSLRPNPLNQVIRGEEWDETELRELADSIQEQGVIEPLLVVPDPGGYGYLIISGERRWRAAQLLGDEAPPLPCLVREPMSEADQLVLMGVENLQRQDMSPVAEARYYQALRERGLKPTEIARQTGIKHSRVVSRLKLLGLAPGVLDLMERGAIPITVEAELSKLPAHLQVEVVRKMRGRSRSAIKRAVKTILQRQERALATATVTGQNGRSRVIPVKRKPPERITRGELELAVRATCGACEVSQETRTHLLWEDVSQALNGQCDACEVRDLEEACRYCPLVDFLRSLRAQVVDRGEPVGPVHLYERGILSVNGRG